MQIMRFLPVMAILLGTPPGSFAQTQLDIRTQTKNVDFSNALSTRPFKMASSLPSSCVAGEAFFKTTAAAGQNWYACTSTNTWVQQSASSSSLNGYVVVTFSSTPTFTAPDNHATTFLLLLTGDVNSSTLAGASTGDLFTFRICQDGSGGHAFTWPATVPDGGSTDPTANSCTSQTFVFDGTAAHAVTSATTTGVAGGAISMPGSSSGATTIQAAAVAGGTLTLPARTATLATTFGASTADNCAKFDASGNLVDSGAACGTGGSGTSSGPMVQRQWFPAATCGYGGPVIGAIDIASDDVNPLWCSRDIDGLGPHVGTMIFDNTTANPAYMNVQLPAANSLNVTLWALPFASGNTKYILDGRCIHTGQAGSGAYPNTASVTNNGSNWQPFLFTNFPLSGCSAGDLLTLRITRDNTVTNNMAGWSFLRGALVEIQ